MVVAKGHYFRTASIKKSDMTFVLYIFYIKTYSPSFSYWIASTNIIQFIDFWMSMETRWNRIWYLKFRTKIFFSYLADIRAIRFSGILNINPHNFRNVHEIIWATIKDCPYVTR
ncbi:MAG: hypothetical protein DRR19_27125 [Candidatus Parabeggiatoa sp. nov. 1]|nr:MAG: hypothetical protein DRR19_27125 [Gammaproteobacteria bacterium]